MRLLRTHQDAWEWSAVFAGLTALIIFSSIGQDWSHAMDVVLACARFAGGAISAALLGYGWVLKRYAPDEKVFAALLSEHERSNSETFDSKT